MKLIKSMPRVYKALIKTKGVLKKLKYFEKSKT